MTTSLKTKIAIARRVLLDAPSMDWMGADPTNVGMMTCALATMAGWPVLVFRENLLVGAVDITIHDCPVEIKRIHEISQEVMAAKILVSFGPPDTSELH